MKLSVESLRSGGGFTGPPVKREIEWLRESETLKFDVYVRRLSYQTAVTDARSLAGKGDLAASRIAHCICDESGKPIFTVADVTGINEDGSPVMLVNDDGVEEEQGALDDALSFALLAVIGEVNGLGKMPPKKSPKRKKSGTN